MAGAASAFFILDMKGRCLIWRDYRGDVTVAEAERYFSNLLKREGDMESYGPVGYGNGVTYLFIKHNNIFLVMASRQNCNVASLISFLHRVVSVFKHYFEELVEESVRDNFVVVYELLDEMMDFGYPQYTEASVLSEFIKIDAYKMEVAQRPPTALTNAVSWRREQTPSTFSMFYWGEISLDVVESVNVLINSNGQVIRSDIVGALKAKTYLSGMPECKLYLKLEEGEYESRYRYQRVVGEVELNDIKFHQCVRLAQFEKNRQISFIPPHGECDLMTYRLDIEEKPPPIWVEAQVVRHSTSRVEMSVKTRNQFRELRNRIGEPCTYSVKIQVPLPSDATNPEVRTSIGSASYAPEINSLIWKINNYFPRNKEYMLRTDFKLPSITSEEAAPDKKTPITVQFEIQDFAASGIKISVAATEESMGEFAYQRVSARCLTVAGDYEVRLT